MPKKIKKCAAVICLTAIMAISLNGCGSVMQISGAGAAIPATAGIIYSATMASAMSEASSADNACKTFYTGVVAGAITKSSTYPDGTKVTAAAEQGASDEDKRYAAKATTVYDSLRYSGLSDTVDVSQMVYLLHDSGTDEKGDIFYIGDDKIKNLSLGDYAQLYSSTSLGELYYSGSTDSETNSYNNSYNAYNNYNDYDYNDYYKSTNNLDNVKSDAASVDNACKTFYAGIKSGAITKSSTYPDGTKVTAAAEQGASEKEKLSAAKAATVADAQKYSGLHIPYDYLCYFYKSDNTTHHEKGDIVCYGGTYGSLPDCANALRPYTTMSTLYGIDLS